MITAETAKLKTPNAFVYFLMEELLQLFLFFLP